MAARTPKKTQPTKNTANTSRTGQKTAAGRTSSRKPPQGKSPLRPEIVSIICIACGLLLMLGMYGGNSAGLFGELITGLLAGLFGIGAYLSPMILIAASLFAVLGRRKQMARSKMILLGLMFWCLLAFAHMGDAQGNGAVYGNIWAYISTTFTTGGLENGGLFGALFGDLLTKLFGATGRYVVLLAVCIVSVIFVTGRSLAAVLLRVYDWFSEWRAETKARREEEYEYDNEYEDEYEDEPKAKPEEAQRQLAPIPRRDKGRMKMESPRKNGRRVFDHVIAPTEAQAADGERLHLINADLKRNANDYYHIFDKDKDKDKDKETVPETPVRMPEAEADTENETVLPKEREWVKLSGFYDTEDAEDKTEADAAVQIEPEPVPVVQTPTVNDETAEGAEESGISVRGVGVEGYQPQTVDLDANGEAYIPTGKAKDKDKILEEMSRIDKAMRTSMNNNAAQAYELPPVTILNDNPYVPSTSSKAAVLENSRKLEETLKSFNVEARVVEVSKGPTVTRYELSPGPGVKVSKIAGLADDLALSLAAVGIRIEAPVPGKSVVGIEIPNREVQSVYLKEVIDDDAFWSHSSKLSFAVGKDIAGNTVIADIARMPHLLIAGATGSGKSVCINTLIASILYKANPDEVKLLMIDPKVVELSIYNGIPHLIIPVVTDPKKASGALNWAVREMDLRYNMFAETKTRDLKGYNQWREANGELPVPQIVIVVDELADLMMTAPGEVEEAICRLAQKARAAGMHLVIATQRPSVDVITGLIKANVPSRLAFAVSSGIDSRTILDSVGAEKLLGKGDMLFSPAGLGKPQRIQGAFISDKEVENLVAFIKAQGEQEYDPALVEKVTSNVKEELFSNEEEDEFLQDAIEYLVEREKASVSNLQRRFRIGYNRASRLMEDLENRGIVGPEDGAKPRKVLMTTYQFMEYKERRESAAAESAMEARQSMLGENPPSTMFAPAQSDEHADDDDGDAPF